MTVDNLCIILPNPFAALVASRMGAVWMDWEDASELLSGAFIALLLAWLALNVSWRFNRAVWEWIDGAKKNPREAGKEIR